MENKQQPQAGTTELNKSEIKMPPLILASASPRRAYILRSVGWDFETMPVDIDESRRAQEPAADYVERLALEKAQAAAAASPNGIILGADTTVVVDGDVLAKPEDDDDARGMLRRLSGRWHEVITGVALIYGDGGSRQVVTHETTRVLFASMSEDEINWYVASGEPMDKAGAYAIQGRAALFVERVEGDYWNIVGLPVRLVYRLVGEI